MANAPENASYTNDPANKPLDAVRFYLGDTDCAEAFLTDEEIRFLLADNATELLAAAEGAKAIAAKVAKRIDYRHGPVQRSASQLFEHFNDLADDLERRASEIGAVPEALGVTISEKEDADADETRVQPDFKKGVHDNPRSGPVITSEPPGTTQL